ncbi:GAF domain-containing sensor histidine kinase [Streptomyces sp. NPDC087440]|uniref:sensor histidine kinase n=1 Tax=Streptomyces sp. NPDC087440 TaxID=3365790 RepID=UPI0038136F4C
MLRPQIQVVRGIRDHPYALLESVLSAGRELDLPQVLGRIAEAAVILSGAQCGGIGVVEPELDPSLTAGISPEALALSGQLPSGHRLLGEPVRHPDTPRSTERSVDREPSSNGVRWDAFLAVPIVVRGAPFGTLCLAGKRDGTAFDGDDEAVLSALAAAAEVAVDNARLFAEGQVRERWLAAGAELTSGLLSGAPETQVLELMLNRAREITSADLGVVDLVAPGTRELRGAFALGEGAEVHRGLRLPREGTLAGTALATGGLVVTSHVDSDPRVTFRSGHWQGLGPAVAIPMSTSGGDRGVLVLARKAGRRPFTREEIEPLPGFAGQAALALELADRRRAAEQVSLLEERDRIARDLHDLAIQRLFATGMTLQSVERLVEHPQATERIGRAVDDLDTTIKIIRSTIFGLRAHDAGPGGSGLRARTARAVEEAVPTLGLTPSLRVEGLLDTDVPQPVADEVLAVLHEALANIARHARASATEIVLIVNKEGLTLTVADNGVGISSSARSSGLRNLSERARNLGGELSLSVPRGGGTLLRWAVPLPDRQ